MAGVQDTIRQVSGMVSKTLSPVSEFLLSGHLAISKLLAEIEILSNGSTAFVFDQKRAQVAVRSRRTASWSKRCRYAAMISEIFPRAVGSPA